MPVTAWQVAAAPDLPAPPFLLALIAAVQPLVLLVGAAFAGVFAAPRVGLRSLVAERVSGVRADAADLRGLWPALLASIGLGLAINLADALARPLWLPPGAAFPSYPEVWTPVTLVFGILYGGITEEIMFRWGVLSMIAWLLWRAVGRPAQLPTWTLVAAIAFAAVLFAAGHLPAVAAIVPLTPGPIWRTLILNGLVGLWLGWIFCRRHLEAAMLAHAGVHVGFAAYAFAALALR